MSLGSVLPFEAPARPARAIDRPVTVTVFPDRFARSKSQPVTRFRDLPDALGKRTAASKDELRWLKLAVFGDQPSAKGCYRTNANMLAVDGVEGDHDAGTMSVDEALARLRAAGLAGIIYTSASHTPAAPRWRVLCPTSQSLPPDARMGLVARLNGVLEGALSPESFTDSQAYYYGRVEGNPHYQCEIVDGRAINEAVELDDGALGRKGEPYQQQPPADYEPLIDGELYGEPDYKMIRAALDTIPPAERVQRDLWVRLGAAVHGATGGSQQGFELWDEWAYADGECAGVYDEPCGDHKRVWNSFGKHKKPAGLGTIIFHAKLHGYKLPPRSSSRLEFRTPADCAAEPSRGYVVKGMIAPGDLACIFGQPGAGKSAVAPLIGYHAALGEPVFGLRTKPGPAFYIAAEDPAGMANRVAALRKRFGNAPGFILVTGLVDLLADDSPDRAELFVEIDERRPSIIFVDTLAMAFADLDENDGKEMTRVVKAARTLAERGPAVVLIHHGTKAEGSTPRGHSVLNGALDVAIQIMPPDNKGVIRARLSKNRNGPCNLDIAFRIAAEELGVDEDGDAITAAVAEPLPPNSAQGGRN